MGVGINGTIVICAFLSLYSYPEEHDYRRYCTYQKQTHQPILTIVHTGDTLSSRNIDISHTEQ